MHTSCDYAGWFFLSLVEDNMIMHGTMIERKCGARKGVNRGCGKKSDEVGRLKEKKKKE